MVNDQWSMKPMVNDQWSMKSMVNDQWSMVNEKNGQWSMENLQLRDQRIEAGAVGALDEYRVALGMLLGDALSHLIHMIEKTEAGGTAR